MDHRSRALRAGLAAALAMFLMSFSSPARADDVAVTLKVGTTGLGGDLTVGLSPRLNARAMVQGFSIDRRFTESGVEYDGTADLFSGAALLDLHPGGGYFRVSAGIFFSGTEVTGVTREFGTIDINGIDYDAAVVGQISGKISANSVAPYLGIGVGNAVAAGGRVRFAFDLGVYYHGNPGATLSASPPDPSLVPQRFYDDLEAERQDLESDINDYVVYPVLSIGVSYRF